MAAREDQLEPLVSDRRLVHSSSVASCTSSRLRLRRERAIATDAVDGAVARSRDEPRAGICGRAFAGPPLGRDRERLLGGLLGEVEVAEDADEAREDPAPLVAEDLLERRQYSTTGRTSTAPPMLAAGTREAISIAASRSSASKKK